MSVHGTAFSATPFICSLCSPVKSERESEREREREIIHNRIGIFPKNTSISNKRKRGQVLVVYPLERKESEKSQDEGKGIQNSTHE